VALGRAATLAAGRQLCEPGPGPGGRYGLRGLRQAGRPDRSALAGAVPVWRPLLGVKTGRGGTGSRRSRWVAGPVPRCDPRRPPWCRPMGASRWRGPDRPCSARGDVAPMFERPAFARHVLWPAPPPGCHRELAHPRRARPFTRASRLPQPSLAVFFRVSGYLTGTAPARALLTGLPAGQNATSRPARSRSRVRRLNAHTCSQAGGTHRPARAPPAKGDPAPISPPSRAATAGGRSGRTRTRRTW
jgi:hypothetical protein